MSDSLCTPMRMENVNKKVHAAIFFPGETYVQLHGEYYRNTVLVLHPERQPVFYHLDSGKREQVLAYAPVVAGAA